MDWRRRNMFLDSSDSKDSDSEVDPGLQQMKIEKDDKSGQEETAMEEDEKKKIM